MKPKFKSIIVSSVPGADWDDVADESFLDLFEARIGREYGAKVEKFSVRKLIGEFAKEEHVSLVANRIQRSSDENVRLLRRLAFLKLEKHFAQKDADDETITIVHTSATAYSDRGKEESLTRRYLSEINPELFVVIIDDPVATYQRIAKREETKNYARLKISDIVRWMENEVAQMEELAQEFERPVYVIPRRQVGALIDLLMTDKRPAYASYAMTQASPAVKERISELVEKLKGHFVVFNPACMGTAHAEIKMTDEELDSYRDGVKKRDEQWFIRINSEYTIVYLPEPVAAHGSQSELDTASEHGKTLWVVLEPGYSDENGRLTPFIDQPADVVFASSQEFMYFLDLPATQQAIYSCITKTMWGFKRRRGLRRLTDAEGKESGFDLNPDEVAREFIAEANAAYVEQMERDLLPLVPDEQLLSMAQSSWDFNRPVWEGKLTKSKNLSLFSHEDLPANDAFQLPPADDALPLAARSDSQRQRPDSLVPFVSANLSKEGRTDLTDDEVFVAIFGKFATGKNRGEWLNNLADFFRENDLGPFSFRIEFLRFLKTTLDHHKYRSPRTFSSRTLKNWIRDFDEGKSQGAKI